MTGQNCIAAKVCMAQTTSEDMWLSLKTSMLVCKDVLPGTRLGVKPFALIHFSNSRAHCTGM